MGDHLEANLRALAAVDPGRAATIAAAEPLAASCQPAASGAPTLAADGVLLHSAHDPAGEAQRWAFDACERLAAAEGSPATAVVFGFGLGWHVEALVEHWLGPVTVVEPDDRLLRTALAARDLRDLLGRGVLAPLPLDDLTVDRWGAPVLLRHGPSLLRDARGLREIYAWTAGRVALRGLRLRVLVVSPLAGGSYPITAYCARALAELGHDVRTLDLAPFASGMAAIDGFSPQARAREVVRSAYGRFLGTGVLAAAEAYRPDLVLVMAQAPVDGPLVERLRGLGALTALWFVEDHRLFGYWREAVGAYDHVFVIQDEPFLGEARRLARGRVDYLPLAADPVVHRPLDLSPAERETFGAPVAFVGAGYRNRRLALRVLLDCGLRIWGSEWEECGPLAGVIQRQGSRVSTEDCVRIFNATTVNVNLHSSTWVDGVDPNGDFVNPRTFELAAVGAFQLVDVRRLLPPLFTPGAEVVTFEHARELRDLVRAWLARPADDRAAIAAAARRRALAEHTYRHRMARLLALLAAGAGEGWQPRPRCPTASEVARLESDSPLGRLLGTLPPHTPFTLAGLVAALQERTGDLDEAESILLFLHHFDQLYVQEARA